MALWFNPEHSFEINLSFQVLSTRFTGCYKIETFQLSGPTKLKLFVTMIVYLRRFYLYVIKH